MTDERTELPDMVEQPSRPSWKDGVDVHLLQIQVFDVNDVLVGTQNKALMIDDGGGFIVSSVLIPAPDQRDQ